MCDKVNIFKSLWKLLKIIQKQNPILFLVLRETYKKGILAK